MSSGMGNDVAAPAEYQTRIQRKGPRLNFRKSRLGCQRCKARRVKCDEKRPVCSGCSRHEVSCVYSNDPQPRAELMAAGTGSCQPTTTSIGTSRTPEMSAQISQPSSQGQSTSMEDPVASCEVIASDENDWSIEESRERRMLELRLLHNCITNVSRPFPVSQSPEVDTIWTADVPNMAFQQQHQNLMNAMFAISASNLLVKDPENRDLALSRDRYVGLALREQRMAVANLTEENIDAICFTSILILINSFATLRERKLQPYTPPVSWLQMGRGASSVIGIALDSAKDLESTRFKVVILANPVVQDHSVHGEEGIPALFSNLLSENLLQDLDTIEVWDQQTRSVYEETVRSLGAIWKAIDDQEPIYNISRKTMAFSMLIPDEFVDFVKEMRFRALLVLAHYFALAIRSNVVWWVGGTPSREVRAIKQVLPQKLHRHLEWAINFTASAA